MAEVSADIEGKRITPKNATCDRPERKGSIAHVDSTSTMAESNYLSGSKVRRHPSRPESCAPLQAKPPRGGLPEAACEDGTSNPSPATRLRAK